MKERDLLENIKNNTKSGLGDLTDDELKKLLHTTIAAIDTVLEKEDTLEVDDFGTFSRRKQHNVSVSFFKPSDKLTERINRRR
ncbi:hypothetical protein D0T53_11620 [Dysgonomonas sp. 216]|uniref:HU family DNA-binding protein n=1 Tax=Dysgonomonas sp. 216 TaxID=2302934 RepID=UPI0013D3A018|nr:HU family DNA-binding protein [Dysgonomonas sp. 216]NDW19554.1 hypothetical protein [Dysgonomonas sp. 216]